MSGQKKNARGFTDLWQDAQDLSIPEMTCWESRFWKAQDGQAVLKKRFNTSLRYGFLIHPFLNPFSFSLIYQALPFFPKEWRRQACTPQYVRSKVVLSHPCLLESLWHYSAHYPEILERRIIQDLISTDHQRSQICWLKSTDIHTSGALMHGVLSNNMLQLSE